MFYAGSGESKKSLDGKHFVIVSITETLFFSEVYNRIIINLSFYLQITLQLFVFINVIIFRARDRITLRYYK